MYNQFSNPNICHFCNTRGKGNLISCGCCNLMFYCNEIHRWKHEESHNEICLFLLSNFLRLRTNRAIQPKWIESRKLLLGDINLMIQQHFNRSLEEYEKQMILWSIACIVCHRESDLRSCQQCSFVNYCLRHRGDFYMKHTYDDCRKFTLSLNINLEKMAGKCNVPYDELFSNSVTLVRNASNVQFVLA